MGRHEGSLYGMDPAWWEEYPRAKKLIDRAFAKDNADLNLIDLLVDKLGLPTGVANAFYDKYMHEGEIPANDGRPEFPYQEKKIREGRRANALKMLSQMHAYLVRYNDLDKTEAHFSQRVEELGGTDLYAIVDAVLDVVETAKKVDKARLLRRVYRKYFPRTQADDAETDQEIIQDLDYAEQGEQPNWPQEVKIRDAAPDEIGGEGDYFADDENGMDEPDEWDADRYLFDDEDGFDPESDLQSDLDATNSRRRRESLIEDVIDGTDEMSLAYDDADEFLNDGYPREQVEVYLRDHYKTLSPEDILEIMNSVKKS